MNYKKTDRKNRKYEKIIAAICAGKDTRNGNSGNEYSILGRGKDFAHADCRNLPYCEKP